MRINPGWTFSGWNLGLSIGHVSPEAANGGIIGLVEEGDIVDINIPNREINLRVDENPTARRKLACSWR